MAVNLFASEKDFDLANVMAINFDDRGRLWALTMPSYPHYLPGETPRDKILILEDTDKDGRADRQTIFADSLYLPTGFELGNGGVYVAEQSNLLFLEDTDGDDRADRKKILLQGFGTEDSHHAPSAFEWGPDGALYFHQGKFAHSQIETSYGSVKVKDGCTFRYEPYTERLETFINYDYLNPWGQVFDEYGRQFVADASDGSNFYGNPMSGKINFPNKHRTLSSFTKKYRPTCGIEILSSRHFADSLQGQLMVNSVLATRGIVQFDIAEASSGFEVKKDDLFLLGRQKNFRPVDLQVAPDGTLYVVDWYNEIIGHMQYSIRDERRDHSHGRIWRISNNRKPLLPILNFETMSVAQLLDHLQVPELRDRYRCRRAIWSKDRNEVLKALPEFLAQHQSDERMWLEAFWLHEAFDDPNIDLL
ncbi:MAG: PVC-type heme-binding CxxCH protein, partial [Bacteroidota bacterium]